MHVHKILDQMAEPKEKPFFKGIIVVKRLSAIGLALVTWTASGGEVTVEERGRWFLEYSLPHGNPRRPAGFSGRWGCREQGGKR